MACQKPEDDSNNPPQGNVDTELTFKSREEIVDSLTNYSFEYQITYQDGDGVNTSSFIDMKTTNAWLYMSENTFAFLADIDTQSMYMLDMEEKTAILTDLDEDMSSFSSWGTLFFDWYEYEDNLHKTGSATIAGRSCDIYEYSFGTLKYVYHLDKEYDICLKFELIASTTEKTTFIFTKFQIGGVLTQDVLSIIDGYVIDDFRGEF